jgi:hypothetical protein
MIASHLQAVSKQPAHACTVPTVPDFITTFQCFGQFFETILGTLTGGGFDTLSTVGLSLSAVLSNTLLLLTKAFPVEWELGDPPGGNN